MGDGERLGRYCFYSPGRCYGFIAGIRGRLHLVGVSRRGLFWRFGATVYSPFDGYWESVFGVRTQLKKIETMLKMGMRNEILPIRVRPDRIRGSIHFSRTGVVSIVLVLLDCERFAPMDKQNPKDFATLENDLLGTVQSRKERY